MTQRTRRVAIITFALALAAFAWPNHVRADSLLGKGWDLLHTEPGTTFVGIPFKGVPLPTFDFGGTVGVKNLSNGNVDTIVRRFDDATLADPMIPIELVALQLQSVAPIDLGAGLGSYS